MSEVNRDDIIRDDMSGGAICCMICGNTRKLTRDEAEYNRYFGTIAGIYICDECKKAVEFAKWLRTGRKMTE